MIYWISRSIFWLLFKACFGYRVKGTENFPKAGPFIIAGNHLSFLDPPAVGMAWKGMVTFLAREDLFHNSFFKWWGASVGVIPIKRGKFDLAAIRGSFEKLKKGGVVALFPEGTRSRNGTIKDPKGGVGFLAVKAKVPVVPVFIRGTDRALPHHTVFIRFKRVEVTVGKSLRPEMFAKAGGEYDYLAFSQEVMREIEELGRE
ncbi:MAG: lysophospholipid acyltransferase family protein [Candidatus Omnitrophica bacterium]|nr:lysophospholipid acyltransferase family protein [Candidatus Omnitrophota bacterium]